ncbi:MAG: PEP-CTERM sorting domain-containing protein [Pirellulaceae bacterium]
MFRIFAIAAIAVCMPAFANADLFISGTSSTPLGGGIIANGTDTTSASLYRTPELIKDLDNSETDLGRTALSNIDLVTIMGVQHFRIFLDQQETGGGGKKLSLTDLVIKIYDVTDVTFSNPHLLWDYNQATNGSIVLNDSSQPATDSPLGNGTDMAILIPRSMFAGTGFRGKDILELMATEGSDGDNGGEEFASRKVGAGIVFLDPNQMAAPVPEPGSTFLTITATTLAFALLRRRKSR